MRSGVREIRWGAAAIAGLTVFGLGACKEPGQVEFDTPVVSTVNVSDISSARAQSGGEVSCNLCAFISNRGVVWAETPSPTVELSTKTRDATGIGTFVSSVFRLEPGTTYYLRAYATNSDGTYYGNEVSFTALAEGAEVETAPVYNITAVSAVCGGDITYDGGAPVIARGVVWSTSRFDLLVVPTRTNDGTRVGSYVSTIVGLTPKTTYYVRAYAQNNATTSYGAERTFTTGE